MTTTPPEIAGAIEALEEAEEFIGELKIGNAAPFFPGMEALGKVQDALAALRAYRAAPAPRENKHGLLPCPFCGNTDPDFYGELSESGSFDCITCLDCEIDGPRANSAAEAARLWNTRPAPAPDELREAEAMARMADAGLSAARRFIADGLKYGYIKMPKEIAHVATDTIELIDGVRAALSRLPVEERE